jgi:hypothetical protein
VHDKEKMDGKQALCRAPEKRTTQILFAAFFHHACQSILSRSTLRTNETSFFNFAVRFFLDARPTHEFAMHFS